MHGSTRARRAGVEDEDEGMEMKLLGDGEGTDEDGELPSIFSPPPERDCAVDLKKKQKARNNKKMEQGASKKPTGSAKPAQKGPASEPPLRTVGVHPRRREDGDVGEGEEESVDRHQLSYRPMRADWNALREKQHQRKREHDNNNDHNHRHHSHQPRLQAEETQREPRRKAASLQRPMLRESDRLLREHETRTGRTSFSHESPRPPRDSEEQDGFNDDGDMSLLVAQTALILTFSWEDPRTEAATWEELLLQRKIPNKEGGKSIPLWEANETLPMEVGELAPQFRKRLGWKEHHPERNGRTLDVWRSRTLKLTAEAKRQLFSSAKLWGLQVRATDGEEGEDSATETEYKVPKARKLRSHHAAKRSSIVCDLAITDIQVVLYPLGTGLLVLEVDWLPPNPSGKLHGVTSIDELRTWLFLSKFRHRVENVLEGWTFPSPEGLDTTVTNAVVDESEEEKENEEKKSNDAKEDKKEKEDKGASGKGKQKDDDDDSSSDDLSSPDEDSAKERRRLKEAKKERRREKRRRKELKRARERHLRSLGRMAGAVYGEDPITLGSLGNWLVLLPDENPANPPPRINRGQRCHHHSTIVLQGAPPQQALSEYLFHLRRGFGQLNRPPPEGMDYGRDKILVHRKNRYIGLSREGTVCISWPTSAENRYFDVQTWPKLFQGIYLILGMQAHAESAVLSELGYLSMGQADMLRTDTSFDEMEKYRFQLRELAAMMVRYTLSMSSDDCGGRSEYAHFFSDLRHVLGTPSAKQEIREQIDDVLAIVESQYMEEQKKIKRREMVEQMEQLVRKKESGKTKEAKRRRFEIAVAAITAITLPILMAAGLFGMNVPNLPEWDFWPLVGGLVGISFLLLIVLLVLWWFAFRNKTKAKEQNRKIKKGLSKLPHKGSELVRKSMEWNSRSRFSMGTRPSEDHRPTSIDLRRGDLQYHHEEDERRRTQSFSLDRSAMAAKKGSNPWRSWKWGRE